MRRTIVWPDPTAEERRLLLASPEHVPVAESARKVHTNENGGPACIHDQVRRFGEVAGNRFPALDFEEGDTPNRPATVTSIGTVWVYTVHDCQTVFCEWATYPRHGIAREEPSATQVQRAQEQQMEHLDRAIRSQMMLPPPTLLDQLMDAVLDTTEWPRLFSQRLLATTLEEFVAEFRAEPDVVGYANLWRAAAYHPRGWLIRKLIDRCGWGPTPEMVASYGKLPDIQPPRPGEIAEMPRVLG